MPKVKYLKDLCSGRAGTVHDLQDYEANVLLQIGAAEIFDEAKNAKAERLAAEQAEVARLAAEQAEVARLAAEQAEVARLAAEQAEVARLAAEQAEVARLAAEQAEVARLAAEQAEAARLAAENVYEQIPPNVLLNLNGRPVVDDFGDMAEQPLLQLVPEKPAKKGIKASK